MHADRYLEGNKTISANFLGQQAKFPVGPFILAAQFKVPISYVFAIKEGSLHYHFFASKIINHQHLQKQAIPQQMVTEYAAEMEIKVKKYPEQLFNYYNFWS
jgi:predicted LPLAT superfamily acyltransferase